jgi:hypothetical protein
MTWDEAKEKLRSLLQEEEGIDMGSLSTDEVLAKLEAKGLLTKSIEMIKSEVSVLDVLEFFSVSELLQILKDQSLLQLTPGQDINDVLSWFTKEEIFGALSVQNILQLLALTGKLSLTPGQPVFGDDGELLIDENGNLVVQVFDESGNALTDAEGNFIYQLFDSEGRPILGSDGKAVFRTYNLEGHLVSTGDFDITSAALFNGFDKIFDKNGHALLNGEGLPIFDLTEDLFAFFHGLAQLSSIDELVEAALGVLIKEYLGNLTQESVFKIILDDTKRLTSKTIYEFEEKEARVAMILSDFYFDKNGERLFGKRTDYTYKGNDKNSPLDETVTFNVRELATLDEKMTRGKGELEQVTDYIVNIKGKEEINTILSDYEDLNGNGVIERDEAMTRQDYFYGHGRHSLKSTERYYIGDLSTLAEKSERGNGDLISASLYRGAKGSEYIDSVKDFNLDGEIVNFQRYFYLGKGGKRKINFVNSYDPDDLPADVLESLLSGRRIKDADLLRLTASSRTEYTGRRGRERVTGNVSQNDISWSAPDAASRSGRAHRERGAERRGLPESG